MGVVYTNVARNPKVEHIELDVEVEGRTVRVRAGKFIVASKSYELLEDFKLAVSLSKVHKTSVLGYLVAAEDGSISVLVDEFVHDGVDQLYRFEDGPYKALSHIFIINKVPPDTADLSQCEVVAIRTTAKEKRDGRGDQS